MTSPRFIGLALTAAPLLITPVAASTAAAQERDPFASRAQLPLLRPDVAGTRQVPGYTAPGIRAGAFVIAPELTVRADADNNVLNSRDNRQGDVALTLAPSLNAGAELSDTRLSLGAQMAAIRYARLAGQNRETFNLQAAATRKLGGAFELGLAAAWARKDEPNFSASAAAANSPTIYRQLSGTAGLAGSFGPSRVTASLDFDRLNYFPVIRSGTQVTQAFRDQRVLAATVKAEHALPAGRTLFVQGTQRWADSLRPTALLDRTSRSSEVTAGLRGDITKLISAELAAGYQWRSFRSAAFQDWSGAAFRAKVEWYATPLVSLQLNARRDVIDAGLASSAGVVVDSLQMRAFYELRRNINIITSAGVSRESYRDNPGTGGIGKLAARIASAGLEVRYALSSKYLVGAYARYRNRSSDRAILPSLGVAAEGGLSLRLKM